MRGARIMGLFGVRMMGINKRIDVFYEPHIGFGIRWQRNWTYELNVSISFPFITVQLGFGKDMTMYEG